MKSVWVAFVFRLKVFISAVCGAKYVVCVTCDTFG